MRPSAGPEGPEPGCEDDDQVTTWMRLGLAAARWMVAAQ